VHAGSSVYANGGSVGIISGSSLHQGSGSVVIQSANSTAEAPSGSLTFESGNAEKSESGSLTLKTGLSHSTAGTIELVVGTTAVGDGGKVVINSGDTLSTSARGGELMLKAGDGMYFIYLFIFKKILIYYNKSCLF
jgi:hypothetical protein